jgi:hypothetical protein
MIGVIKAYPPWIDRQRSHGRIGRQDAGEESPPILGTGKRAVARNSRSKRVSATK